MKAKEAFNIEYRITGREDGRWIIQAFDRNDRPIGTRLVVKTPDEAWKIWMMMNGYYYSEPFELLPEEKAS